VSRNPHGFRVEHTKSRLLEWNPRTGARPSGVACLDQDVELTGYASVRRYEASPEPAVPFDAERPLLFHVLTGLPKFSQGDHALLDMLRRSADLVPPDQSGRSRHLIMPRDAAAGDGQYVFLSPLNTFRLTVGGEPALAFDARRLWNASPRGFAFRVRDLEPYYVRMTEQVDTADAYVPEDFDDWSQEQRDEFLDEDAAAICADDLEWAAAVGTQTRPDKAWELLDIYVRRVTGQISSHAALQAALPLLPCFEADDHDPMTEIVRPIQEEWRDLFGDGPTGVRAAIWEQPWLPEILYPARLPLCCASFWRDHLGVWHPVPRRSP